MHSGKSLITLIALSLSGLLFTGCAPKHAPLPTVKQVDLNRYMGTWYEIARYPHSFEKGCSDVSATYFLRDDGKVDVLNRCTKSGIPDEAHGVAYATNPSNTRLKVTFFRPFYGDYWILMLDEAYTYAVIGDPSRKYFWILSRKQTIDSGVKRMILEKLPQWGYSANPLIWTPHSR